MGILDTLKGDQLPTIDCLAARQCNNTRPSVHSGEHASSVWCIVSLSGQAAHLGEPAHAALRAKLLVLVALRLHALVVLMLRHFLPALLLDGTHLYFSFG
jgi:hypothetical protein